MAASPKEHRYLLVDVFTNEPFGGNQLAFFPDASKLHESQLHLVAREMNFSETAFAYPARDKGNAARLRIFTPEAEVPYAGHPVIGSSFALDSLGALGEGCEHLKIELEGGEVPVQLRRGRSGRLLEATMVQQDPIFLGEFPHVDAVAGALGLHHDDIAITGLPCEVISTGLPFHIVPVGGLDAMRRITLRPSRMRAIREALGFEDLFVFCFETEDLDVHVHSRMFAPGFGIPEDPATGSASGALGAYLFKHRVLQGKGPLRILNEQGLEMGRPSRIAIEVVAEGKRIQQIRVGGAAVIVGEGVLRL